jgi:hypothetical protein
LGHIVEKFKDSFFPSGRRTVRTLERVRKMSVDGVAVYGARTGRVTYKISDTSPSIRPKVSLPVERLTGISGIRRGRPRSATKAFWLKRRNKVTIAGSNNLRSQKIFNKGPPSRINRRKV